MTGEVPDDRDTHRRTPAGDRDGDLPADDHDQNPTADTRNRNSPTGDRDSRRHPAPGDRDSDLPPDGPGHDPLVDDLAAALADRHDDLGAGAAAAVAATLLARDAEEYVLVGLAAGAARAVYFQPPEWAVRSIAVAGSDVPAVRTGRVEREHVRRASEYVREQPAGHWTWLHPRFRWARADGREPQADG